MLRILWESSIFCPLKLKLPRTINQTQPFTGAMIRKMCMCSGIPVRLPSNHSQGSTRVASTIQTHRVTYLLNTGDQLAQEPVPILTPPDQQA